MKVLKERWQGDRNWQGRNGFDPHTLYIYMLLNQTFRNKIHIQSSPVLSSLVDTLHLSQFRASARGRLESKQGLCHYSHKFAKGLQPTQNPTYSVLPSPRSALYAGVNLTALSHLSSQFFMQLTQVLSPGALEEQPTPH